MDYLSIISKVIPIIVLISIGYILKLNRFISTNTIDEIKKLIINISLPALLFTSFLDLELELKYLLIILIIFASNILMLYTGKLIGRFIKEKDSYFPLLFGGFEMGMLGFPLFGIVYGTDNIKYIGILDIGQEFYVWFILLAILLNLKNGEKNYRKLFHSFITSPVILAIIFALVFNLFEIKNFIANNSLLASLLESVNLVGSITIPLILIVIGYEANFKISNFYLPLKIISIRLVLLLILAVILNKYILTGLLNLGRMYNIALMTMFILPPPFIIPLFIKKEEIKGKEYIYNTLSLGLIVSLLAFIVVTVFYSSF